MDYYKDLGEYNFSVVQGATDPHSLFGWQIDGVPFSLEDADEIRVDFREDPRYSGPPDFTLTKENGGIKAKDNSMDMLFGKNTLSLRQGLYHYDVLVVKKGIRHTYVRGQMILTGVITR